MSYLIIGETGESKHINSTAELKSSYNKYLSSLELTQKDVLIISSQGKEFVSIDLVPLTPDSIYFLYAKQFSPEMLKLFDQSITKLFAAFSLHISLNLNSIPDMAKYLPTLEANARYLKGVTPVEIKAICNGMIDFYDSFKLIFTKMNLNCKQSEKYKECYQNQINGLDAIYKQQAALFDLFVSRRKEFYENHAKLKEKTDNTLRTYSESIEKLKTMELHPAIQTAKHKHLIDIYYEEEQMNKWRDKCILKFQSCTESMQAKEQTCAQEKNRVRNEKNTSIAQLNAALNAIVCEYDKLKREKSSKPLNIITELGNEFNKFKSSLNTMTEIFSGNRYNANPNYVATVDEAIEYIKSLKAKYSNLTISSLQTYLEPFNEQCLRMRKLIETSAAKVNGICNVLMRVKLVMEELTEKVASYVKNLDTIEKDFAYLDMPLFFIHAYKESLGEIRRRLMFNSKIQKDIDRLQAHVLHEVIMRKQYIQDYERKVPQDYFKQFLFCDISLNIMFSNGNETQTLPNILTIEDIANMNNASGFLMYPDDQSQTLNQSQRVDQHLPTTDPQSQANTIQNTNENQANANANRNGNNNSALIRETDLELIKSFAARIQELEALQKLKDSEIKKSQNKADLLDKKSSALQLELNSIRANYDNISDNFVTQLALKEQRIDKLHKEADSLKKYIASSIPNNKMDSCPMCKEAMLNSREYQQVSEIVKEYQDKVMNKIKVCSKLEKSFNDLLSQTTLIKKTFFVHMNETIEKKSKEMASMKLFYENRCMHMEDLLSLEKQSTAEHVNSIRQADDVKLKELCRQVAELEADNKKLRAEKEIILKKMDDSKQRESLIQKDFLLLQSQSESIVKDMKTLESQADASRRKTKQLTGDLLQCTKDLQKARSDLEAKSVESEELEKALIKSKEDHVATMNEVHKINQANIDILSKKIDDLTNEYTQKNQSQRDSSKRLSQIEESFTKTNDENSKLKQKVHELTDKLSTLQSESLTIKEMLSEKEKKISELEATASFKSNTHITTAKDNINTNTNEITSTFFNNSEFLLSSSPGQGMNDYISFKKMEKGTMCIFVPHSEGIYVCINLSQNVNCYNDDDRNKFFRCHYILNLDSFAEDLRELIIDNSLIVIGKASKLTQHTPTENDNPYNLPEDSCYTIITIDHPDYVLGFPGEEMIFRNYISFN